MPFDWISIGSAVAKAIAKLWLKDSSFATDLSGTLIDDLASAIPDQRDRRSLARYLERVGDRVTVEMEPYFEAEFRGLEDGDRASATYALTTALQRIPVDHQLLVKLRFDPHRLEAHLLESRHEEYLSPAGEALFEILVRECSTYIIECIARMPDSSARTSIAIFQMESEAFDSIEEAIANVPKQLTGALGLADPRRFELDFRREMARQFDDLALFGVTGRDGRPASHSLSVAYFTLTVDEARSEHLETYPRIDEVLGAHARTVIRGEAGSGKTTLLQWLAVHAARESLVRSLSEWNGRVPFFIRLRDYSAGRPLPVPSEFLEFTARFLADTAPPNWVHQVLASGRGLVLVDGLDELAENRRGDAEEWLAELSRAYPESKIVLTSRPSAIDEKLLKRLGFRQTTLRAMSVPDIYTFIDYWHRAATRTVTSDKEAEDLIALQVRLLRVIDENGAIRSLASNPLLCALLCSLSRDRRGHVPRERMEIYRIALETLLQRRDEEREIEQGAVMLNLPQKLALLGDVAYWMLRTDKPQVDTGRLIERLRSRLAAMPQAVPAEAEDVYQYLLRRSGILREPAEGQSDFVHLTFQEYLAASEICEQDETEVLRPKARRGKWREVVVMTAGHANEHQRRELIEGLLAPGEPSLDLLALACLEVSPVLDPSLVDAIRTRLKALIPPKTLSEAQDIAAVGEPAVLGLREVDPESVDEATAVSVISTLCLIGGDAALDALRVWKNDERLLVRAELIRAWSSFDSERYANVVLKDWAISRESPEAAALRITVGPREFPLLGSVPWAQQIEFRAAGTGKPMDSLPPEVRQLRVVDSGASRMPGLVGAGNLEVLELEHCAGLRDLDDMRKLPRIRMVRLSDMPDLADIQALEALDELETVILAQLPQVSGLPTFPAIKTLQIKGCRKLLSLDGLIDAKRLTSLRLEEVGVDRLPPWRDLPALKAVEVRWVPRLTDYSVLGAAENLTSLSVTHSADLTEAGWASALSGVTNLSFEGCSKLVSLSGLEHLAKLEVLNLSYCTGLRSIGALRGLGALREVNLHGASMGLDMDDVAHVEEVVFPYPY